MKTAKKPKIYSSAYAEIHLHTKYAAMEVRAIDISISRKAKCSIHPVTEGVSLQLPHFCFLSRKILNQLPFLNCKNSCRPETLNDILLEECGATLSDSS